MIVFEVPVILKIFVSLMLILLANRFVHSLSVSLAFGALVLAFWSGHSVPAVAAIAYESISSRDTIFLLLVVFLVVALSSQMSSSGIMRDLVIAVRGRVSRRFAMGVLPALIGLLPMPGGALFSAPLVNDCDDDGTVESTLKVQSNFWFRHVWEWWWPLYPAVMLAIGLTDLEIWQFMLMNFHFTIVSVLAGWFFLLRKIDPGNPIQIPEKKVFRRIGFLLIPVGVVIGCYAGIRIFVPGIIAVSRYLPICIGVIAAIFLVQIQRRPGREVWKKILFNRRSFLLCLLVAILSVYGGVIQADLPGGGTLVNKMRLELQSAGIPVVVVIFLLPFVSGLATGLGVGFVGASFPIVLSLFGDVSAFGQFAGLVVLAFGSGYIGMMLSPVHVCFVVTNEYFRTRISRSIIGLLGPAAVMAVSVVLTYFVLSRFFV